MRGRFLESFIEIGCTVWKRIANKQTDRQTDKQTFFFIYIDWTAAERQKKEV